MTKVSGRVLELTGLFPPALFAKRQDFSRYGSGGSRVGRCGRCYSKLPAPSGPPRPPSPYAGTRYTGVGARDLLVRSCVDLCSRLEVRQG
jgi:hypothetical protein